MSMILKGIDLPKEGLTTNINILSNGDIYVSAFDGTRTNYEVLRNSAIQIPKGHGRLGDLDELEKSIEEVDRPDGYTALVHIKYAPTILEAEE